MFKDPKKTYPKIHRENLSFGIRLVVVWVIDPYIVQLNFLPLQWANEEAVKGFG